MILGGDMMCYYLVILNPESFVTLRYRISQWVPYTHGFGSLNFHRLKLGTKISDEK